MAVSERGTVSNEVGRTLRTLFKRCLICPSTVPTCPTCDSATEICSLVPQDCYTCAHMTCIANPSPAPPSQGPNVGAIAGGVIGGIVAVAVIVFFIWRFWIKKRREQQELEAEEWEQDDIAQQKASHQFNAMHTDAASTRTRASFANSILSRASNIIQIAYIPGVTNRNGSGHNSLLTTTPVPPIPAAFRNASQPPKSPLSNEGDALFFRPGDLRDSTYSATSSLNAGNRDTQYTRQSITPSLLRSSVVSEIYRDDATAEPMPAQAVMRVAPRMVSVKHSPASTPPAESPTPSGGNGIQIMIPGAEASTSGPVRTKATQVTLGGKGKGRFPVRQASSTTTSTSSKHVPTVSSPLVDADASTDDEAGFFKARQSTTSSIDQAATPLVQPVESPFYDASENIPDSPASTGPSPYANLGTPIGASTGKRSTKLMGGLSAVIEEATRRASRVPSHDGLGGKRNASPFSDEHETS